ncbi:hypothetical protein [Fodinibius salicampi]
MSQLKDGRSKNIKLIISILFPPFPIAWLFWDMYSQSQYMKEEDIH